MSYTTEVSRRVYNELEGVSIEIKPSGDCPGFITIWVTDKKSKDWFGPISFTGDKEFMRHLGMAIVDAANQQ